MLVLTQFPLGNKKMIKLRKHCPVNNTNSEYQIEEEVSPFPGGADIGSSQLQLSDSVIN